MIVFGSGGHTGEMLILMRGTDWTAYKNIIFVKASSDTLSYPKFLNEFEKNVRIEWIDYYC